METNSKNYEKAIYALEKTKLEQVKLSRKYETLCIITETLFGVVIVCAAINFVVGF